MYGYDTHFMCAKAKRVLVTGAGGRTGRIVVRKLLQRGTEEFTPRAMVRSQESEDKLRTYLGYLSMVDLGLEIVRADVTKPQTLGDAFKGMDTVIICTGAKPQISKASLAAVIALKLASFGLSTAKPSFWFEEGQSPEEVDWISQRAQIDAAKEAGVKHIVLVSSMAGTKPDHFLNTSMDNMALWKRKAEKYLMESGVPYTIIHAGGLLPHGPEQPNEAPVEGGRRQLFVGVDDALMDDGEGKQRTLLPREDLAEVGVQCIREPTAIGRSFDLGSGPEGEGEIFSGSLDKLLLTLEGKNCSYALPSDMLDPGRQASRGGVLGCCKEDPSLGAAGSEPEPEIRRIVDTKSASA